MRYRIVHELSGRLRLQLELPCRPAVEKEDVEAHFHDLHGVDKISFSPRTRTLLVRYDGRPTTRQALLRRIVSAPQPRARRRPLTELEVKKRTVVRSGTLLLVRPLVPPPIRPLMTTIGAMPILRRGARSLWEGDVNVDVLDASAIAAAMGTRDFFTASMISFLLKLGDYLEEWTRKRSRAMLTEMFHTDESEWVWVLKDGQEERIPLADLAEGDTVVARTGGLIPADGKVVDGEAMVNQASMTGEGLPVTKRKGSSVYAGTAVEEGQILVRAEQVGEGTRAARVVKVIEEAESLKGETQSHGEQLAEKVVPYSFALSGLTFLLTGNLRRAAAVLLVDYSCAIKLSTPLAVISSLAKATRHRVLIKGGRAIENLSRADAFVLDKTGTLTEARPQVVAVTAFNGFSREYVLRQAACVEEHFPHPVAQAVVAHAEEKNLTHAEEHAEVDYVVAHGIVSHVHGQRILVGSRHFINEDEKVDVAVGEEQIAAISKRGDSVLYVAIGGELAGLIAIRDPLREEAAGFVARLREAGIGRVVMLTGDNEATARTVAARVGIDEYHARALPDRKVEIIRSLQEEGHTVVMVGDGINDSAALSFADVGISMRHGADIAKEACDVLLMEGELDDLLAARAISIEAMDLIRENYRTIVGVNSAAMIMALSGQMPPIFSATLHNMSTIAVGLKALKPLKASQQAFPPQLAQKPETETAS